MCLPKAPPPQKLPPPPKRGMDIPELLDLETLNKTEDSIKKKSQGLGSLRINLNTPSSSIKTGSSGLQVGN